MLLSGILDSASVRQPRVASLQPAFVRCRRHPVAFSENLLQVFASFPRSLRFESSKRQLKKIGIQSKFECPIGYTGFEPATSTSRTSRATSCANTRKKNEKKSFLNKSESFSRAAGLEPAISGVTGQRDNQLRYARVMFVILHESEICVNKLHHKKSKKIDFFKTDYAK